MRSDKRINKLLWQICYAVIYGNNQTYGSQLTTDWYLHGHILIVFAQKTRHSDFGSCFLNQVEGLSD